MAAASGNFLDGGVVRRVQAVAMDGVVPKRKTGAQ